MRLKTILSLMAATLAAGLLLTAQTQTAASTSKKTTPAAKTKATKKTVSAKAAPPVRRYVQQQPTVDRYKEIQQALADRGYFRGPVDGQWGIDSVDALKQFQREQSIDDDGKINSMSLIALGLGPHRTTGERQSASTRPAALGQDAPAPSAP